MGNVYTLRLAIYFLSLRWCQRLFFFWSMIPRIFHGWDERKTSEARHPCLIRRNGVCAQLVLVHGSPQKDIITQSRLCQDFIYISSSLPLHQVSLESLLLTMRNLTSFKNDVEWIYPVSVDERENNKRTSDTAVGGLSLVKDAAAVIIIIYNKEKGSLLKSRASISRSIVGKNLNLLLFLMVYNYFWEIKKLPDKISPVYLVISWFL